MGRVVIRRGKVEVAKPKPSVSSLHEWIIYSVNLGPAEMNSQEFRTIASVYEVAVPGVITRTVEAVVICRKCGHQHGLIFPTDVATTDHVGISDAIINAAHREIGFSCKVP